ncbi:hypothetical protein [Salinicola rhizosphaerae]|uniref:Uncharacterized protein n=1 Tax=Salinicola rhizosphaerae TaxID=1443141 RepID=A0ABQ3DWH0_9GAMM|nr:hypothetical protein [Salinicola rhizosphaerae]GHB12848.1 hypothetical protein GCM10009038_08580 [Salinicola rhizosphaerae]
MRFDHVKILQVVEQDNRSSTIYSEGFGEYKDIKTEHSGSIVTKVLLQNIKTGRQRTWSFNNTKLDFWQGHELIMAYDEEGLIMFYNKSTGEIVRMRGEIGFNGNLKGEVIKCGFICLLATFLPIFGLLTIFAINKKSGNGPEIDKLNKHMCAYVFSFSLVLCWVYYNFGLVFGFGVSVLSAIPITIVSLIIGFRGIKGGGGYFQSVERSLMAEAQNT